MLDFPTSPPPTTGQQFTAQGVVWTWDGAKWTAGGVSVSYVPTSGGTMTGPLILSGDPTVPLGAVDKQYVDARPIMGDNRIINGDMRIDARNNGASGTANNVYTVDRWQYAANQASKGTWQRGGPVPGLWFAGSQYYLVFTSSSAYAPLATDYFGFVQSIEADMITDFGFGQAAAQPITLSFLASASQAGTFSGAIVNDNSTRSYAFTYTINTANVWQRFAITIPGDTSGTWVTAGNARGMYLIFDLGAGANRRTSTPNTWQSTALYGVTGTVSPVSVNGLGFEITGVKLEVGSVATPFNHPPLAQALAACQRYYYQDLIAIGFGFNSWAAGGFGYTLCSFPVTMRAAATVALGALTGPTNVATVVVASGMTTPGRFVLQANSTAAGACAGTIAGFTASAEL